MSSPFKTIYKTHEWIKNPGYIGWIDPIGHPIVMDTIGTRWVFAVKPMGIHLLHGCIRVKWNRNEEPGKVSFKDVL